MKARNIIASGTAHPPVCPQTLQPPAIYTLVCASHPSNDTANHPLLPVSLCSHINLLTNECEAHTCNHSTWEAKLGHLQVLGLPGRQNEALYQSDSKKHIIHTCVLAFFSCKTTADTYKCLLNQPSILFIPYLPSMLIHAHICTHTQACKLTPSK